MSDVTIMTTEEQVVLTTASDAAVTVAVTEQPVAITAINGPTSWGTILGTLSAQADLETALDARALESDLTVHEAATTSVHGIADTSAIHRTPTLVVAASDAPAADRALADYVCDGTADNVEIEAALAAISAAGGGRVQLTGGTFTVTATMHPKSNTLLSGCGMGATILQHGDLPPDPGYPSGYTANVCLAVIGQSFVQVRDLTLACVGATTSTVGTDFIAGCLHCSCEHVEAYGYRKPALRAAGVGTHIAFCHNYVHDTFSTGTGILLDAGAGADIEHVLIQGNYLTAIAPDSAQGAISVWVSTATVKDVIIINNHVTNTVNGSSGSGTGIRLHHVSSGAVTAGVIISNNIVTNGAGWGIQAHPALGTLSGVFITHNVASTNTLGNYDFSGLGSDAITAPNIGQTNPVYLVAGSNLSDVASATTARTNLGLGTAATQASSAFLQPANNLSDVGSAATARSNLGVQAALGYTPVNKAGDTLTGALVWDDLAIDGEPIAFATPIVINGQTVPAFMYLDSTFKRLRIGLQGASGYNEIDFELPSGSGYSDVMALTTTSLAPAGGFDNALSLGLIGARWAAIYVGSSAFAHPTSTAALKIYRDSTNSVYRLHTAVASTDNLSFTLGGTDVLIVTPSGAVTIKVQTSSTVGLSIKGAASQSGDLQQWQNSGGTVLSRVNASGQLQLATSAGAPSGTPANGTMVYDTTNNVIYCYNGGWKKTAALS